MATSKNLKDKLPKPMLNSNIPPNKKELRSKAM